MKNNLIVSSEAINGSISLRDISQNSFSFNIQGKWLINISYEGKIEFNKKEFPDMNADDFAKEFIKILEEHLVVLK